MSEGLRTCESDPIYLHPDFAENKMMYPFMWTGLKASVIPLFPRKQGKRLKSCQELSNEYSPESDF